MASSSAGYEAYARAAILIGERLTAARKAKGLSKADVASAAALSAQHYALLESGKPSSPNARYANPRLSTLYALAEILDVEVMELMAP